MASCSHCGTWLAPDVRFCPHCGRRTGDSETEVMEVPPDETGRVPVTVTRAERRLYGVTPAMLVFVLAAAALVAGFVLVAIGHWPFGLIALGVAVLLVLVALEAARRQPTGTVARSTAEALEGFRERAGVAAESLATRGRAARQLVSLRRDLQRMSNVRSQMLFELGDAVYRSDEQATEAARNRIEELDRLAAQREVEMQQVVDAAHDRLARRRLEVQPTEVVEPPDEPAPAPGEGNPPEPARIPEPYPPPDEGNPPQPAVIPEPGPAVIPEPGPRGSEEETG